MRNLIAAIYFLLALFGYEGGGTTVVTHARVGGVDVIHSRMRLMAGIARFECLASASGECHYTLFPDKCASTQTDCDRHPIDRFTMPAGEKREVVGLPAFTACVSQDDASLGTDCSRK